MYRRLQGGLGYEVVEGPFTGYTVIGKSGNFHAHAPDGRAGPTKRTRQQALDALKLVERPPVAVAADQQPELIEVEVTAPTVKDCLTVAEAPTLRDLRTVDEAPTIQPHLTVAPAPTLRDSRTVAPSTLTTMRTIIAEAHQQGGLIAAIIATAFALAFGPALLCGDLVVTKLAGKKGEAQSASL